MKRVNKYLLTFIVLVTIILGGVWKFLQTETFAQFISHEIAHRTRKHLGFNIEFEQIDVTVLPPRTTLHKVSLNSNDYQKSRIKLNTLSFTFSIFDFFSRKLSVSEIALGVGFVELNLEATDKKKNINLKKYIKDELSKNVKLVFKKYLNDLPVNIGTVKINDLEVFTGGNSVFIEELKLEYFENLLDLKINISDFKVEEKGQWSSLPDTLKCEIEIEPKKIRIKEFLIQKNLEKIKGEVVVNLEGSSLNYIGGINYLGGLESLNKLLPKEFLLGGYYNLEVGIHGNNFEPVFSFNLIANDIRSEFAEFRKLSLKGSVKESLVFIEEFKGDVGKGDISLKKEVALFDLKNRELVFTSATVKANNIFTNDALFVINNHLNPLKGYLNGFVDISLHKNKLQFKMQEGFELRDFQLKFKGGTKPLISNERYVFANESIVEIYDDFSVLLDLDFSFVNSRVKAKGVINSKGVSFKTSETLIDMYEFGPISSFQMKGVNKLDMSIEGPFDDIVFRFNSDVEGLAFLGMNFGDVTGDVSLKLNEAILEIEDLNSKYKDTEFFAKGFLDFKSKEINIDIDFKKTTYADTLYLLDFIASDLKFLDRDDIELNFSSSLTLKGGFNETSNLIIEGEIKGGSGRVIFEEIDAFSMNYLFKNSSLSLTNIFLKKGSGSLRGRYFIDTRTKDFQFDSTINLIKLSDFNIYSALGFGYNGLVQAKMSGEGNIDNFSSKSFLKIRKGEVDGKRVGDSFLNIFTSTEDVYVEAEILKNVASFQSYLNLNKNNTSRSTVKANVKTSDMNKLLGLISARNISRDEAIGLVDFELNSDFDLLRIDKLNATLKVNEFKFSEPRFNVVINKSNSKNIVIENGHIKKWDLYFSGKNSFIKSMGRGKFFSNYNITSDFSLSASILEYWGEIFEDSSGLLDGSFLLKRERNNYKRSLVLRGNDVNLRLNKVPVGIEGLNFNSLVEGDRIEINDYHARVGGGDIKGEGTVELQIPFPLISIRANLDSINIPLLKKSAVTLGGNLKLEGDELPYKVTGGVSVLHGEIREEISDFGDDDELDYVSSYLPKRSDNLEKQVFDLDIIVSVFNPLLVKNSFSQIDLDGGLKVIGSPFKPFLNGRLKIAGTKGKFIFKGHEFELSEGELKFNDTSEKKPMSLNFVGVSQVSDYQVKIGVTGESNNPLITIESSPPLSQEDILSLLTIGITADVSQQLSEEERQSVTTLGIGTLLVDQFKLNEGLNSALGLKLSIAPEFTKNETALLQGKSGVSDSRASTVKSATKVKLQKQLHKKVDLSVSSTVGGTIDEKQEMNLQFKFNEMWSIDAVYEINSSDDSSEESPDSIGMDLKFRRSY